MAHDKFTYIVFFIVILLAGNTYMSYRAFSSSREAVEDRTVIQMLQGQVNRMNAELADLNSRLGKLPERTAQNVPVFPPPPPRFGPGQAGPKSGPGGPGHRGGGHPGGSPEVGPFNSAPPGSFVPSEEMVAYKKKQMDRNVALHRADAEHYGGQLAELYNRARTPSSSGLGTEERDSAFAQLVEEYPEANSTNLAIGERALESALQANTVDAERYYNMLAQSENTSSLVTDSGVEIVPAIQGYLADQYIQQGRFAEAESLISALEGGEGYVAVPGPRGEPEFRPASEVANALRQRLNSSKKPTGQ